MAEITVGQVAGVIAALIVVGEESQDLYRCPTTYTDSYQCNCLPL